MKTLKIISGLFLTGFIFNGVHATEVQTDVNNIKASNDVGIFGNIIQTIFNNVGEITGEYLELDQNITNDQSEVDQVPSSKAVIDLFNTSSSLWTKNGSGKIYYSSGSVGVGTDNPAGKFHVVNSSADDFYINSQLIKNVNTTGGWARHLEFRSNGGTRANFGVYGGNNTLNYLYLDARGTNLAYSNAQFVLKPNGNVGIGTTSPQTKLHVSGVTRSDGGFNVAGTSIVSSDAWIEGDRIKQKSIDDSEIEDDSLTEFSLAPNSVGISELKNNSIASTNVIDNSIITSDILDNTITEADISDTFKARDSDKLDGQNAHEISWGHDVPHGTYNNFNQFNNTDKYGAHYVTGSDNGPATGGTQYYHARWSLGSNYNNYGMQMALPRNVANPYISIRYEEGGSFGAWQKISAGRADIATNSDTLDGIDSTGFIKVNTSGDQVQDNTIDGTEIQDNTLTTSDILNNTITENDISDSFKARDSNTLDGIDSTGFIKVNTSGDQIQDNTIDGSEIQDNSITSSDLAPNSVGDSELIDNPSFSTLAFNKGGIVNYKNLAHFNGSPIIGVMKITMAKSWSNTMGTTTIKGYNYNGIGAWEVVVSGYNYTSQNWYNASAEIRGDAPFNSVRLGHDGSKNIILLGTTSTAWSYPKVVVSDFIAAHSSTTGWGTGWSISIQNNETGFVKRTAPVIKTYLDTNGNFGIGDTTPEEKLRVNGRISIATDPNSGDDVGDRDYNDIRYINVGESGDSIADNTIDGTEIQDNTVTAADLAVNSVGNSELIDTPTFSNVISNNPTASNHVTTKSYVDSMVNGLSWKEPVVSSASATYGTCTSAKESWTTYNKSDNIIYVCNGSAWVQMSSTVGIPNLAGEVTGPITSNIIADNVIDSANVKDNSITTSDILNDTITETDISDSFKARDSDKLDGVNSTSFLRSDISDDYSGGNLTIKRTTTNEIESTGDTSQLEVFQGNSTADSYMTFHIGGDYAVNFGLDGETNELSVGGWSMGANKYRLLREGHSGDYLADNTIDGTEIQDNSLTAADLAANSVGNSELGTNSVTSANIIDNSITTSDILNNTITEDDISDTFKARDSDKLDGYDSGDFLKKGKTSEKTLNAGWYTIAKNTGNRASAKFIVRETRGGSHQAIHFYAQHHYGTDSSNVITVLANSSYGGGGAFRYLRIKEGSTYAGAVLQVYIDINTTPVYAEMIENIQSTGWTMVDWGGDGLQTTPNESGLSERVRIDLDRNMGIQTSSSVNADGGLKVGGTSVVGSDAWVEGDRIRQNTIDGTEIQDNSLTAADLAVNSVGNSELRNTENLYVNNIYRSAHNKGHLVGSYNSVGANSSQSNPIYSIGSSYMPGTSVLNNFYGMGYSHGNASFLPSGMGWGAYVAADGDARHFLDGSTGVLWNTGGIKVDAKTVVGTDGWTEGDNIRQNTIDSSEIQDNTLTASDLAANSVGNSELGTNAVASINIIDNSVTTSDILNNTITETDISDSFKARDSDKLDGVNSTGFLRSDISDDYSGGNLTIKRTTTNEIESTGDTSQLEIFQGNSTADSYMTFHIGGDYAVNFGLDGETNELSVGGRSMGANKYRLLREGHSGDYLADNTIDGTEIQDNSLTAADLAANSVGNSELGTNSVASVNIIDNSITTSDILNNTITENDISDSFKARDSDKLDGVNSTSFLRADQDDLLYEKIIAGDTNKRRAGMYGTYSSTKVGHIWSMGSAYQIPENGANFGNLYGFAYKHTNNTTGGSMAGGHQGVWAQNGVGTAAIGSNIWTSGAYISDGVTVIGSDAWVEGDRIRQNSIDGGEIQNDSLTAADLAANSVGNSELKNSDNFTMNQVQATGFYYTSDRRLKENIGVIADPLKKIMTLNGVMFDWKKTEITDIGFIAQEVEETLPELVHTGDDGMKAVKYGNITALLVEAMKEQQKQISSLSDTIKILEKEIQILKK